MTILELLNEQHTHFDEHEVFWYISDEEVDLDTDMFLTKVFKKYHKDVCFGALRRELKNKLSIYVYFGVFIPTLSDVELLIEEQIEWLKLSQQNGCLPDYIDVENCIGDDFAQMRLNLLYINNLQQLYIYLSTLRYLREDPALVRLVLQLTKEGIDYFAAMQIGVEHYVDWSSHSILDRKTSYIDKKKPGLRYEFAYAKALKYLVNTKFLEAKLKGVYSGNSWDMFVTINNIVSNNEYAVFKQDIFDILKDKNKLNKYMQVRSW